jgi:putative two-component system response regulator
MNPSSTPQFYTMPIVIVNDTQGPLSTLAHNAGYQNIFTTSDPYQAIEHIRQNPVDLFMLQLDTQDLDIIQFVKSSLPQQVFPLIALLGNPNDKQQALNLGVQDVLEQPLDDQEALSRIYNLLFAQNRYNHILEKNRLLEHQLLENHKYLETAHVEMLTRLAKAAEYRDDESDQHIWRVAKTSALLAKELGLASDQVDLILRSARLHDVGKIALPDGLLFKPTPLTHSEFEVIKSHTTIGAQILSGGHSTLMKMAESIAMTHHERWDGAGYPRGLKGEAIPVEGRILAVADTLDVLTHDRVYRRAISIDEAATEIKKQRGYQFDPKVVDAFVSLLRKRKLPVEVI